MKSLESQAKTETGISLTAQIGQKLQEVAKNFCGNKVLLERSITFESIVQSKEPSVRIMRQENYKELFAFVLIVVTDYFDKFQPQLSNLKNEFAADLIENRDNWRADDFINMFKFFRTNPADSNLNMNYERMMKRVADYESKLAQAFVQYHASKKGEMAEADKQPNELTLRLAEKFKSNEVVTQDLGMGKQYDNAVADRERTGKNVLYKQEVPDQKYFDKLNSQK